MEDPDLSSFENFLKSHLHDDQIQLDEDRRLEIRARHHAARSDAEAELASFSQWLGEQLQPREAGFDEITTGLIRAAMEEVQDLERFADHIHEILPQLPRPLPTEQDKIRRRVGTLPPKKHSAALSGLAAALALLLGLSYFFLPEHQRQVSDIHTGKITQPISPPQPGVKTDLVKGNAVDVAQASTHGRIRTQGNAGLNAVLDFAGYVPQFSTLPISGPLGQTQYQDDSTRSSSRTLQALLLQPGQQSAYRDAFLSGIQFGSSLIEHGQTWRASTMLTASLPRSGELSGEGKMLVAMTDHSSIRTNSGNFGEAIPSTGASLLTASLSASLTDVLTAGSIGDAITQGNFEAIKSSDPDDTGSGVMASTTNNFTLATAQPYLFRSLFYEETTSSTLVASNQVGADLFFLHTSSDYGDDLSSSSTNHFNSRISIETPLLKNITAGIGFDKSWSDARIDQYGSLDLRSDLFRIFLKNRYGDFYQQLSYSYASIRQHMNPDTSAGDQDHQDAAMSDLHYFGTLELGDDHFSYGPFLDLSYLQGSTDSLKETGGARISPRDFDLGDLIMGMRFSQNLQKSGFGKWRVREQLAWQHSLLQPDSTIREKSGSSTLDYTPNMPDENSIIGGVGLEWNPWTDRLSLQADYTLGLRNANEADQSLLLRLYYSF